MTTDPLAASLTLPNGTNLRHRLVKASMEEALSDAAGDPTPGLARVTRRWAEGGAALLLTGHVIVDRAHRGRPRDVVLEDEGAAPALKAWSSAARSGGGQAWMQLNHAGRQTPRFIHPAPLAPSAGPAVRMMGTFARPRAMSEADIEDVVARFARAAAIAQRTGWDGVEIHAAHGYLLAQFLSPLTNVRTDRWGGPVENRARLLLDVVRAVRARTGAGFGVAVKINSADFQRGGFDAEDFAKVAVMLDGEGVDMIEISGGNYESPVLFGVGGDARTARTAAREAYFLDFAREVRGLVRAPLLLTGGFRTRAGMEQALAQGIDLIGLARPLALEPDLPRRLLDRSTIAAAVKPVRAPVKALAAMADGAWPWMHIRRMSQGLDPDPSLSATRAMATYLAVDLVGARLSRTRPRPPVAAPVPT